MLIKNDQWINTFETVTGKTHVKMEMPNQDAVKSELIGADIMISAVADGHGSKKCSRSHLGAQFAVEAAIETARSISHEFIKNDSLNTKVLGKYFTKRLVRNWREKVTSDLEETPIDLESLNLSSKEIKSVKKNPFISYGSTLLMVLFIREFIVCYQLGDGDILFVSKVNKVTKPIKRDTRHIANDTTSLCLHKPEKEFRIKLFRDLNHLLQMIILSTDGYSNSFSSESGFFKVGSDLYDMIKDDGFEVIEENLKDWIEETSNHGSGDDTSVSIISRLAEKAEQTA